MSYHSVFRSEKMALCQIYIPTEAAYSIVAALGEHEIVEFRDMNPSIASSSKKYINEVKLCEEIEGKLYYIYLQTVQNKVPLKKYYEDPPAPSQRQIIDLMTPGTADFDLLRKLYTEIKEVAQGMAPLKYTLQLHLEYQAILRTTCSLLYTSYVKSVYDPELGEALNLKVIGGVIPKAKWNAFERTLWRLCHGNYVLKVSDIALSNYQTAEPRRLFVVLVHGEYLRSAVQKLSQGFSVILYDIPKSKWRCSELYKKNKSEIADLRKVIATSNEHYSKLLTLAAGNVKRWLIQIRKMKAIYHTMNMLEVEATESFVIADCWLPLGNMDLLNEILIKEAEHSGAAVKPMVFRINYTDQPPTYFRLNKFTVGFQKIIDAYGIATYKELNPMPYTIITFPFLFSVMFGDCGHGLLLTLFASITILCEEKITKNNIENELWTMLFGGRYIILLMGIASLYSGFVYNDVFSCTMNIFGAIWFVPNSTSAIVDRTPMIVLKPWEAFSGAPPPFGMDPTWKVSENGIDFFNSFKMKMSIILGVLQMSFGLCLSFLNALYFKDYLSIFSEFIPQMIFFMSLFAYLAFLIVFKWITYGPDYAPTRGPPCAPSIIITFIRMILFTNFKLPAQCDLYMYENQQHVEKGLLLTAMLCIPWLLIVKPAVIILSKRSSERKLRETLEANDETSIGPSIKSKSVVEMDKGKDENETGEVIIHQCIHTIEYVLGCVSYTASYLRLWALSLAHSQLSEVLWALLFGPSILKSSIPVFGSIIVVAIFFAWAFLTLAILVIMEGLSAFLHALRLHWMEFQSKFYQGQGYPFTPFSFRILKEQVKRTGEQLGFQ